METTNEKCNKCKTVLFLNEQGEKFCFQCTIIAKEDEQTVKEITYNNKVAKVQRIYTKFQENSLMNPKLEKATLQSYIPPNDELLCAKDDFIRFIDEYDPNEPTNLLVVGNYGTGKSHLAAATTKEFMKRGYSAAFIQVNKLMTKIQASWNNKTDLTEDEIITFLSTVDLLVIDDFGAELTTKEIEQESWKNKRINQIIDNRVGRATILTTNFTTEDLFKMYGEREFSRVLEDAKQIEMYGDNYRLRRFKK